MVSTDAFAAYRERIARKAVEPYIPPKFIVTKGEREVSSVPQLNDAVAKLAPETWFVHSPAGSGKTSLATRLLLDLLARDIAGVLVTVAHLKSRAHCREPHELVQDLQPSQVSERLWAARAKAKHGNIVILLDGINEIQREFAGRPQWDLVLKLLNGNHNFPVLATSRYLPDELDRDDSERDIFQLSLRPFSATQIESYLNARGLNTAQILDAAAAAGMGDAASNPFLLSLIADHYAGDGFSKNWPHSRAELLRRTSRIQRNLSPAQKSRLKTRTRTW